MSQTTDKVNYSFGITMNMGDYESARVDVSYETEVKEDETPEEAYSRAVEFVEAKVGEKQDELAEVRRK